MDDALTQLRSALAGRYAVEQELGQGGMAVVYLARDLRHDRKVAIKVLRQDVGGASAERFLREIRTVAQLHHPHILQLLDSGTAGDHLFYVMPYVEGETLRERLERQGPLPIDEAVRIAREVADALAFAHGRGIVHRDIKPENVFLSAGHALVADFGIARAAESATGATTLTDVGLAVGTPAYMSPEQATAEPKIDGRSDQYALGCVLYEMLAGAPPFTGPTSQAIMARHTADPVPPLRTVRDVPVVLDAAITKALAKMPADRWSDATAFAAALDAPMKGAQHRTRRQVLLTGVGAALVFAGIAGAWAIRSASADDMVSLRSLALRPFVPSGDSLALLYAEGMAEGLLPGLHRVEGIAVSGPQRSRSAADETLDDIEAGQRLGVDAVLSGEVRVVGGALRVTPRLTRVRDGATIWTDKYDAELTDVFDVQDRIAVNIVTALAPRLASEQRTLVTRGRQTRDQEAYQLYLRARQLIRQVTPQSVAQAIALLEEAVSRDSTFVDAWVALADAHTFDAQLGSRRPIELASAMHLAVQKAIDLDDSRGEAYAVRGALQGWFYWNWDELLSDFRRAVALSPGSPGVWLSYAQFLNGLGEHDSALVSMKRSIALDSLDSFAWANLSFRYGFLGMVDSAIFAAEHALALDSTQWVASFGLSWFYKEAGRTADAIAALDHVNRYAEDGPASLAWRANAYANLNRPAEARAMANRLISIARMKYVPHVYIGMARLVVGDTAGAFASLEQSVKDRDFDLAGEVIGAYSVFRGNPRFEEIGREIFKGRWASPGSPPPRSPNR